MAGKCPVCGAPLQNGGCGYCGYHEAQAQAAPQSAAAQPTIVVNNVVRNTVSPTFVRAALVSSKNRTLALILCLVFGFFGAHQFYSGRIGRGILYLFTMGLFGIGWFIDLVKILLGSYTDKFGLPIKNW